MPTIDSFLTIPETCCSRCGHLKAYHTMIFEGKIYLPCIRKKPYKLGDGADVKLGMQVWQYAPYNGKQILTGMVRYISGWGELILWKYPEDRIYLKRIYGGKPYDIPIDLSIQTVAWRCFSSLENALTARDKDNK